MKKIITYIFSGVYYSCVMVREFGIIVLLPVVKWLFIILYSLWPAAKRRFKKRGITVYQHIDDRFNLGIKMERNDIGGFMLRHVEYILTIFISLFYVEIIIITKRILNIEILNYFIHNGQFAVVCICVLLGSTSVDGIEKYIFKGKRPKSLEYKPKKYKIKSLLAFFAFSIATVAIFIILCETS